MSSTRTRGGGGDIDKSTQHNIFSETKLPLIIHVSVYKFTSTIISSISTILATNTCLVVEWNIMPTIREYVTQNKRVLKVTQITTKKGLRYKDDELSMILVRFSSIIIYILCITRSEFLYFYWHCNIIMFMYISQIDNFSCISQS